MKAYLNNFFWLFLTYFAAPCLYFLIFFFARRPVRRSFSEGGTPKGEGGAGNAPLKILVIQTAKIGDLVCSTPVFREIKKKFPDSYLTVLINAKAKDILKNNPRVDQILPLDSYAGVFGKVRLFKKLRKEKYDWAINLLPGSFNNIIAFWSLIPNRAATCHKGAGGITGLLSVFNNYRLEYKSHTRFTGHYLNLLKFLDIEHSSEEKEIFIRPQEEKKALDFLAQNNLSADDLLIGISAVPGNKIKQWDLSKFAVLADLLADRARAKIIFTGAPSDGAQIAKVQEMMQNNSINSSGFFRLHELPALFKKLKLFISVDSGPVYIADALGVPVIDIGGSYDIQEQAPSGNKSKILQKYPVSCSFIVPISLACIERHQKNLRETAPEEVFAVAISLI